MSEVSNGILVVLEGIDGAGTTTQAERLGRWVSERGGRALVTREPSGGPVGQMIRTALRSELVDGEGRTTSLDWKTFALLFAADRVDHLEREILPALREGRVVICDRYDLSSLIYQSATSPEGEASLVWLRQLNARARRPDFTIVLDVPHKAAEARRCARDEKAELFEKTELQERLSGFYGEAGRFLPNDPVEILSTSADIDEVFELVLNSLLKLPEFARMSELDR